MNLTKYKIAVSAVTLGLILALTATGQTAPSSDLRDLPPNQMLEREISGAETHRYRITLRKDEFLQVRVEQKGVDVLLKLLGTNVNVLAKMDSPNGKQGPETLSFVARQAGSFVLEVNAPDTKAERGAYSIRREAARKATAQDRRRAEAECLFVEGMVARSVEGQSETAIAKLEGALKGWRELKDAYLTDLTERQVKAIKLRPKTKALIAEFSAPSNLSREGLKLIREGKPESVPAALAKFTEAVEAARRFSKRLKEEDLSDILTEDYRAEWKLITKINEAEALSWIGNAYQILKDWQGSVNYNKQAVAVIREIRQDPEISASKAFASYPLPVKVTEAGKLSFIASTLVGNMGKLHEGLTYAEQALTLWREVKQEHPKYLDTAKFHEALTLQIMAQSHLALDDRDKAIQAFEQAAAIFQRLPNQKRLEASMLLQIGNICLRQLNYEKALKVWRAALKIYEELGDKKSQASVLGMIGLSYFSVNDEQKAREYFNRQLAILLSDDYLESAMEKRSVVPLPDHKSETPNISAFYKDAFEWERSVSVGNIYTTLGEHEKGRAQFEKSLTSARATKNQDRIRLSLTFIGGTHERQEKWQEALDYYSQALKISRLLPGKSDLAGDLSSLAFVNIQMKQWRDALQNATEALLIYQSLGADKSDLFIGYAGALNLLARAHDGLGSRRLAIFYQKHAVNAIQRERQQLKNLDQETQRGYLKKNERPYRRLADWLIAEGRIAEAEQVLEMLKAIEYLQYLRRDDKVALEMLKSIPPNAPEREAIARFNELADRITAIGKEYDELEGEKKHWQEQAQAQKSPLDTAFPRQAEMADKEKQLASAREVFVSFLDSLDAKFKNRQTNERDVRVVGVSGTRTLLAELKQPRTVIISTIAGEDRLNLIVTTARVNRAHTVDIKAADLNKLVVEFRANVKNPNVDPRPAGKKLYDILFPPGLQKDLAGVAADTIVWSLDGTLRYAPIAALWDGKQYLAEKYANAVITLARGKLREAPTDRKNWTALGVGVSQTATVKEIDGEPKTFPALPAVPEELCGVVNDTQARCAVLPNGQLGVLAGNSFLDEAFTFQTFKDRLGNYPVIHIASHFSLNTGDYSNSFLLLGGKSNDERKLTLQTVRVQLEAKFIGVELLTLSACNTAMSAGENSSNGLEVESFGALAQDLGAKSVLASLWSVADPSTRDLMVKFYEFYSNGTMTKAEALRQAQLALLSGATQVGATPKKALDAAKDARDTNEIVDGNQKDAAPYPRDAAKRYAHPYYWAPFVLFGNWR